MSFLLVVIALCDLAASLNPSSHGRSGWQCVGSTPNTQICNGNTPNWGGLACANGVVTSVFLPGTKIVGTIPTSMGYLSRLTSLDLHSNNIYGSIPDSLGQMTSLSSLKLDTNSLSGSVPSSLCSLPLTTLTLTPNSLGCYALCLSTFASLNLGSLPYCTSGMFLLIIIYICSYILKINYEYFNYISSIEYTNCTTIRQV